MQLVLSCDPGAVAARLDQAIRRFELTGVCEVDGVRVEAKRDDGRWSGTSMRYTWTLFVNEAPLVSVNTTQDCHPGPFHTSLVRSYIAAARK